MDIDQRRLIKALDSPVLKKKGKTYTYTPQVLPYEVLSKQCEEREILLLRAKHDKSRDPKKTRLTEESEKKMVLDDNKNLQTFILSFDNHEHSEGFAVFKKEGYGEEEEDLFFLMPFSTDEYTTWIDKKYLYDLVAEKLGVDREKIVFIDKEHLSALQADDKSCHTMALANCIKTNKHPEVIENYIDEILGNGTVTEKDEIKILKTNKYYPVYASLSQSLSKLANREEESHLDEKYLSDLFIFRNKPTKKVNPKLQLKTIQYSSKQGKTNVKKFKEGEDIGESEVLERFQEGYCIDPKKN